MKKIVKIVVIAMIAAAVGAYAISTAYAPLAVRLHTVEPGEAHVFFTETGVVADGRQIRVYPGVSGDIQAVSAKSGQTVKKGDMLFLVDPKPYADERAMRLVTIRSIEANIASALNEEELKKDGFREAIAELSAELNTIEAQRVSARAASAYTDTAEDEVRILDLSITQAGLDREFWQDRLESARSLFDSGAAAAVDVSDAEKRVADIDKQIAQYEEQIAAARSASGRESSRADRAGASSDNYYNALSAAARERINTLLANLEKDYAHSTVNYYRTLIDAERERIAVIEADMGKCEVTSPVDGRIVELAAENANYLAPQSVAAVIQEAPDGARIESYVSTRDIARIKTGDAVLITLKGRDEDLVFDGMVSEIREWAETRLSALGIEEKRVKLTVDAADPEAVLKPGYETEIRYTLYRGQDKLLVPNGALFTLDGADCVFVRENGVATVRPVVTGMSTTVETVIENGLSAGEAVVAEANTEGLVAGKKLTGL